MHHKAIMGIRSFGGEIRLVLKLKVRKNMRYRNIQIRPCFRQGRIPVEEGLCPVHHFRPLVTRRVTHGDLLFPLATK